MPLPTSSDLHVDRLLTDYAINYGQNESAGRFAREASTIVPVDKQSDKYNVWDKGDFFRLEMDVRADGAPAAEAGFRLSNDSYFAKYFGLRKLITDRQRAQARDEVALEEQTVRYLANQALMRRDVDAAAAAFITGVWTSNTEQTGVSGSPSTNQFKQFNDSASDPLGVVDAQKEVVRRSIGKYPNVGAMGPDVMNALRRHADINGLYNPTSSGVVSEEQVAAALGLDKVVVLSSIRNTANENATDSMADIFGKHLTLTYVAPSQSLDEPTATSTFVWDEFDAGDSEAGMSVKRYRDDERGGEWFEISSAFVTKITANDAGVMLLSAVA